MVFSGMLRILFLASIQIYDSVPNFQLAINDNIHLSIILLNIGFWWCEIILEICCIGK